MPGRGSSWAPVAACTPRHPEPIWARSKHEISAWESASQASFIHIDYGSQGETSKIVLQTSSHIPILWVFPSNSYFHRQWASQKISKETFCLGRSLFREQKPWENHQTCTGGSGQDRNTCHCFKKIWQARMTTLLLFRKLESEYGCFQQ